MSQELVQTREHFIQGMSRITHFWGFPEVLGVMYGIIYLSPHPVSLDELVEQTGSNSEVITSNLHMLERLSIVHKQLHEDDTKDYYIAETDFWQVLKNLMQEREKNELGPAIHTIGESWEMVRKADVPSHETELAAFYQERMLSMKTFFDQLENLMTLLTSLDAMRLNALMRFFANSKNKT